MKKIRKTLSVLLVVLMLLTSAPLQGFVGMELPEWLKLPTWTFANAASDTIIASGNCGANGDNVTWVLYDDGELVISGEGPMEEYVWYSNSPFSEIYDNDIINVSILEGVTSVGQYTFSHCPKLKSVKLPDGMKSIGHYAFINCYQLETINLPDSINYISSSSFIRSGLSGELVLPKSLTTVEVSAFEGCSNLTSIVISDNITSIKGSAFKGCTNLKEIYISKELNNIGNEAFSGCTKIEKFIVSEENMNFSSDVEGVLFNKDKSKLITFPLGNKSNSYIVPTTVKVINSYAFRQTNLEELILPEGLTEIGEYAFYTSPNLIGVEIPNSVTIIGSRAFYGCGSLQNVKIGAGVVSLNDETFYSCPKLKTVQLCEGLKVISKNCFRYCSSLENIFIPSSVNSIGNSAFDSCTSLREFVFPNGVLTISSSVLFGCSNLKSVVLGNDTTSIGISAFNNCVNLESISLPSTVTSIGRQAFLRCNNLKYFDVDTNNTTFCSVDGVLFDKGVTKLICYPEGKIMDVYQVPSGVTDIGRYSFSYCRNVANLALPKSLKYIDWYAFENTQNLKNIFYEGSTEEWRGVGIGDWNKGLNNVKIYYNNCRDHSNSISVGETLPDCTNDGYTEGVYCNTCKVWLSGHKIISATGHSHSEWTIFKEATLLECGEKHRTCTACQELETEVIERIIVDAETNENYGVANFTILNSSTKAPIKNASIFVSTDAEGESTFYTDENGKVSIVLPIGENVITAHAKGLISRTLTIDIVHGENEIPAIGLGSSPIVEAELVTTPMTKEEIEDAGIDVTAPGNNNVIKYEVTFEFTAKEPAGDDSGSGSETEVEKETVTETFYVNGNGEHFYQYNNQSGGTYEIFGEPVTIHPTERFYLIITGDLIWLKEMFHVQLYAYNNSNTDWIEDTVATLQLPDGLSLADMSEGKQTLSQQMGTISEGGQADCEWYVRGDKEGIYDLTAKLEGRIMPFNEEFSNEYTAEEAIKVYSGKAFNISFEVPTTTYCGDEYPVKITLENVSDKPIYNVAHVLTGISQTKVTHYTNGEAVEEIYVKETLDKAKFVDEFNPGDKIVLDVTAKILFESEKYKDCFFELVDIVFGAKELGTAINNNFGFPTEHDWNEWETVKEPTCGEVGQAKRVCKHNETHIEYKDIETLPHEWDEGVINPVSTCRDHGIKTYTCKNDASHTKQEKVPLDADNHIGETYIADEIANACEEDGYTGNTYCLGCNAKLAEGESIAAHGHDYHKIDEKCKAPDYGIAGYDYYECSYNASHNYTVEVAPLVKTTFTAKFITTAPFFKEDKAVAEVTFVQGDKFVEEPAVDKYDNYTFAWDEYELKDEDIVIYGRYTEIEINDITTPEAEKKAEFNNGVATITLEAKANSKNIKILSEKTKPVDVVLVLDQSGSMAETLSTNRKTKRDALVECANDFVKELYDNAVATGAEHRVAVVGFSYSDYNGGNYKNTGILATETGKIINYKSLKDSHYASALMSVATENGINANITKGINSVVADGATSAHLGLEMANNIFAMTNKESGRERIVLFITDGTPTSWGEETALVKSTAAKAITEANELKNAQGAKIYSIGVHANANPIASFTSDDYGVATDNRGTFKSYDFNRFLHAVSSNYPTAGSIRVSEMGEGSKNSGYYLGVQDTSKLSEIFSKILLSSVYEVKTFDKVTIVDTVSKEFTLTLEQETEMRERLINELGIRNEDITVTRNADGTTTLRFDNVRTEKVYNDDGSSYYSAKVSFDVSADEDSIGLTEVNTNTEDAGVEYDGEAIDKFEVPSVILAPDRKLVAFTVNGVVYRIEEAKLGDNIVAPESELAEWNIPEGTVVEGDYVVFEANAVESTEYTVTWVSENSKVTETYSYGEEIFVPEAAEKNGYDFLKWSPDIPATMPNYNITFTATYTPKHSHTYNKAYTYGKCTEGITTVYECACGDSYEVQVEATEHNAKAVVEQTNDRTTLIEKVTCQVCGVTNSQELTYKVTYKEGWWNATTVLDLSLLENEVQVQPDGTIEIKFYVGENINKNYTVYRIDENGNRTSYTPRKENGYLIFDADHFSFYVVAELDETTGEIIDDVSYEEVYCISNGHSYEGVVTEPTCTDGGYTTYTCSVCKDTHVADEVSANGHKEETIKGKGATCTETGITDGVKCGVCGDVLIEQNVIQALGHTEETIKGEAPSCTKTGLTDGVKCGLCGEVLMAQIEVAKLEHKDADGDYKCDYGCGHEFEKPIEPDLPDEPTDDNCDHLCHKGGFMGFLWKIVRFFIKLFRTNKVCSCGVAHY